MLDFRTIIIIAAVIFGIVSLYRVDYLFYFTVFSIFYLKDFSIWQEIKADNLFIAFLILVWVLQSLLRKRTDIQQKPVPDRSNFKLLLFMFLFSAVISIFMSYGEVTSEQTGYQFRGFVKYWVEYLLLGFVMMKNFENEERIVRIVKVILILSIGIITMGIIGYLVYLNKIPSYLNISDSVSTNQGRLSGIVIGSANALASLFLFYSSFFLAFYFHEKRRILKMAYLTISIFFMIGICLTVSRGGLIGLLISVLIILYLRKSGRQIFFVIAILFLVMYSVNLPRILKRYNEINLSQTAESRDIEIRLKLANASIQVVKDHLLFGVGPSGYQIFVSKYMPVRWKKAFSHNIYFSIAVEHGLIGLVLFLSLLSILLRKAYFIYSRSGSDQFKSISLGYLAGLSGILITGFSSFTLLQIQIFGSFAIFSGLILSIDQIENSTVGEPISA
jgi:O-antigen ligase